MPSLFVAGDVLHAVSRSGRVITDASFIRSAYMAEMEGEVCAHNIRVFLGQQASTPETDSNNPNHGDSRAGMKAFPEDAFLSRYCPVVAIVSLGR
jgi:hypothetical protein